jgi:hypothetical protein
MDVGRREDKFLDELEFLYQQRRDARYLVGQWGAEGGMDPALAEELLTLLTDRKKEGQGV